MRLAESLLYLSELKKEELIPYDTFSSLKDQLLSSNKKEQKEAQYIINILINRINLKSKHTSSSSFNNNLKNKKMKKILLGKTSYEKQLSILGISQNEYKKFKKYPKAYQKLGVFDDKQQQVKLNKMDQILLNNQKKYLQKPYQKKSYILQNIKLHLSIFYDTLSSIIYLKVLEVINLPKYDAYYVKIYTLPDPYKKSKQKTKIIYNQTNAIYNENFKINKANSSSYLLIALWCERLTFNICIGYICIPIAYIPHNRINMITRWFSLYSNEIGVSSNLPESINKMIGKSILSASMCNWSIPSSSS